MRGGLVSRVFAIAFLVAAVVGASFVVFLLAVTSLRGAVNRESHSKDVTAATLRLEKLVVDLETGIRGWTLTVNPRFLQPYTEARRALPARLDALRGLVAKDPRARAQTEGLAAEIDATSPSMRRHSSRSCATPPPSRAPRS